MLNASPRIPSGATLFGVPLFLGTLRQGIARLERIIAERRPGLVVLANAHTFNLACESDQYKAALRKAQVVFRDGVGVEWALRRKGAAGLHNFVGTDFIPDFCRATAHKGYRFFLLGARPGISRRAAEKLALEAPGTIICGYHHGYFREDRTLEILDLIKDSRPDVLLVAMGNPAQELWITRHLERLTAPACIGVGALFDNLSGAVRRAPRWMLRAKMEWVFRLLMEPRRLAKRYVIGNARFLFRAWRESRKERFSGRAVGPAER